jgi:hypothetical protein
VFCFFPFNVLEKIRLFQVAKVPKNEGDSNATQVVVLSLLKCVIQIVPPMAHNFFIPPFILLLSCHHQDFALFCYFFPLLTQHLS